MKSSFKQSIKTENLGKLSELFASYPEIDAVYLFGSHASEKTHAESDVDLAVVCKESSRPNEIDLLADLTRAGLSDVDLVFLPSTDTVLQYEAIRMNRLIYATDNFSQGAFYSRVIRSYLDLLPYLERQRKAYRERIQND